MALGRQERRELVCPLLTESSQSWRRAVVKSESYAISHLAGRLDSSLDFSGALPMWLPHSPAGFDEEEQALDLRVACRRRADSLDRSPSPAESESTGGSPGRPLHGPTGVPGSPAAIGDVFNSPPVDSSLCSSPPQLSSVCSSPPQLSSVCSSPPQLSSVCSSPARRSSVCSSPASPGSPEWVARGRQTSVIRRLVLESPAADDLQPDQQQQKQQQQEQQRREHQQEQRQVYPQTLPQPQPQSYLHHQQQQQPHDQQQQQQQQYPCDQCGRKYSTASNLARHRQLHCLPTDKKARKCPECDKIYVSMPAYSMHVRTHAQGCRCPYCGKAFSRPWLLQGHVRTHTGERPFRCPVCAKAFADKSNLRAHVQTHSNVKPHVCQRCGKAFALKSYLYKHEESSCMKERRSTRTAAGKESSPREGIQLVNGL